MFLIPEPSKELLRNHKTFCFHRADRFAFCHGNKKPNLHIDDDAFHDACFATIETAV